MPDPLLVAGLSGDVLAGAPGLLVAGPRALRERDEFGRFDGIGGLLRATVEPITAREDLGHALCAWLPREDRL